MDNNIYDPSHDDLWLVFADFSEKRVIVYKDDEWRETNLVMQFDLIEDLKSTHGLSTNESIAQIIAMQPGHRVLIMDRITVSDKLKEACFALLD